MKPFLSKATIIFAVCVSLMPGLRPAGDVALAPGQKDFFDAGQALVRGEYKRASDLAAEAKPHYRGAPQVWAETIKLIADGCAILDSDMAEAKEKFVAAKKRSNISPPFNHQCYFEAAACLALVEAMEAGSAEQMREVQGRLKGVGLTALAAKAAALAKKLEGAATAAAGYDGAVPEAAPPPRAARGPGGLSAVAGGAPGDVLVRSTPAPAALCAQPMPDAAVPPRPTSAPPALPGAVIPAAAPQQPHRVAHAPQALPAAAPPALPEDDAAAACVVASEAARFVPQEPGEAVACILRDAMLACHRHEYGSYEPDGLYRLVNRAFNPGTSASTKGFILDFAYSIGCYCRAKGKYKDGFATPGLRSAARCVGVAPPNLSSCAPEQLATMSCQAFRAMCAAVAGQEAARVAAGAAEARPSAPTPPSPRRAPSPLPPPLPQPVEAVEPLAASADVDDTKAATSGGDHGQPRGHRGRRGRARRGGSGSGPVTAAVEVASAAVAVEPAAMEADDGTLGLMDQAWTAFHAGDFEEAVNLFTQAAELFDGKDDTLKAAAQRNADKALDALIAREYYGGDCKRPEGYREASAAARAGRPHDAGGSRRKAV